MKRILFPLLLFASIAHAQTPVTIQADCAFSFSITATSVRATAFDNRFKNCVGWVVTYFNNGFSGTFYLELDSAPDSSGTPGSWTAFSGTVLSGANPQTSTANAYAILSGYNPWISVILTSGTGPGTVTGTAQGCRVGNCAALFAASGGVTSNVNLAQVNGHTTVEGGVNGSQSVGGTAAAAATATGNPVLIGGEDGSSKVRVPLVDSQGNLYSLLACPSSADVALSGTGYTEIVAGVASQVIRVCKLFVTSASGGSPVVNTITVATATVTTCASPTELLVGASITGIDSDFGGALRSGSGASICVKEGTANSDHVTITYQQATF